LSVGAAILLLPLMAACSALFPAKFPVDTRDKRFTACNPADFAVLAAFPIRELRNLGAVIPHLGSVDLGPGDEPAFVVVFRDPWHGPTLTRPGTAISEPSARGAAVHDLCVWVGAAAGVGTSFILRRVDVSGLDPGHAT
jgi:hypothetical protein